MDKKGLVLLSQPSTGTTARASSVLQRNVKLYGPKNALDIENGSTCWNSDGSTTNNNKSQQQQTSTTKTWYTVDFGRLVQPLEIRIQFQAGFAAEQIHVFQQGCVLSNGDAGEEANGKNSNDNNKVKDDDWKFIIELEADTDDHDIQNFSLVQEDFGAKAGSSCSSTDKIQSTSSLPKVCHSLKLVFDDCHDFYGRITIYQLQVWGYEVSES